MENNIIISLLGGGNRGTFGKGNGQVIQLSAVLLVTQVVRVGIEACRSLQTPYALQLQLFQAF